MSPKQQNKKLKQAALRAVEKKMANKMLANARKPKARGRRANRKGNPIGPSQNFSSSRGGALGLGSGTSGATSRRSQVIEEDEYIGEVAGSSGFATTSYAINPGQLGTFPWGNKIAQLYEEYDFEFLEFYYKREVSEFATNGQVGKVILSCDYDASDAAPTTKQQVEDTVPHIDGMPCTPLIILRLDPNRMRKGLGKYVRPGLQPANTDIKTYDVGNLYVTTQGCTNTSTIGELRVRYRVRLSQPVLEASSLAVSAVQHLSGIASTTAANLAGLTSQAGSAPLVTAAVNTVTFPAGNAGRFLVFLSINAATSVTALSINGTGGGVTTLGLFATTASGVDASNNLASSTSGASPASAFLAFAVTVTAAGGTVLLNASTITTSGTTGTDLWVIQLPPALVTSSLPPANSVEAKLARLERLLQSRFPELVDSEFEDESTLPSPMAASSSSATTVSLSSSALGIIGEIMARKSALKQ
jgi:hypothetical protein